VADARSDEGAAIASLRRTEITMTKLSVVVFGGCLAVCTTGFAHTGVRVFGPVATPNASGQQCGQLQYGGGALVQKAKLASVFWGAAPSYKDTLGQAYAKVMQSPYFDFLREYNQGSYKITRGTFIGSFADATPPASKSIDDQQDIQPWLQSLITANKVPAPDDDTIYMLHFPAGVSISQGGAQSCNQFCAYHGSFQDSSGRSVRYGVIPDQQSGGCQSGCGTGNTAVDLITEVASHELIEAVTDPDGGSGWYNNQCGEIGDICVGADGSTNGVEVQKEWSNKQNNCVDHDPAVTVADFSLALDQASVMGYLGAMTTAKVTATPTSGSPTTSAALVITGLPMGVTAALSQASIMTNASSTITFTVASSAAAGSYPFTVTGSTATDNVIESVSGTIVVSNMAPPPPDMGDTGGGGNGGSGGGGGSGGSGGGVGSGGGGNGSGGDHNTGSSSSGCSYGGAAAATGPLLFWVTTLIGFAVSRRRKARG
jgi:hypothetical protein